MSGQAVEQHRDGAGDLLLLWGETFCDRLVERN
jgi:hypothetical protein